jgi:hypothetical protein
MRARCLTFLACLACGVLVAGVASCSAAPTSSGGGGESTGAASATNVGTAEFELTIGSGVLVSAVTYSLTGPGNFSERGTVDVSHSDTVSVLLGGLLPGSGYVVSLQAQSIGGAFTCSGQSAPFCHRRSADDTRRRSARVLHGRRRCRHGHRDGDGRRVSDDRSGHGPAGHRVGRRVDVAARSGARARPRRARLRVDGDRGFDGERLVTGRHVHLYGDRAHDDRPLGFGWK